MTTGPFERDREAQAPPWLGETGRALARVQGRDQDDAQLDLKAAVKLRFQASTSPDALDELGFTRGMEQAPIETDEAFVVRCARAHGWWQNAGTPAGIRQLFAVYGYTDDTCLVVPRHLADGVFGLPVPPEEEWFSEFIVSLGPGYFEETDDVWDDAADDVWDDWSLWGMTGTTYDLAWLRRGIRRLKAPWSYPVAVYLLGTWEHWSDPGVYDDGGFWGAAPSDCIVIPLFPVWGADSFGLPAGVWKDDDTWADEFDAMPLPP